MSRRLIALIAATTLVFAMLPGGLAAASAAASGQLIEGLEVFPGTGADGAEYRLRVQNTESSLLGLTGERIRFVQITLPRPIGVLNNDQPIAAPSGWDVQRFSANGLELIRFTGGELAPGSSEDFSFPADVLPPPDHDRSGRFGVSVSSDADGSELRPVDETGNGLSTLVRTLQLLDLEPVAPPLAISPHRDMTAGGTVTYRGTVRNFAQNGQDIVPTLRSSRGSDDIDGPGEVTVPGEGTLAVDFDITLGATNSDTNVTFTFDADADNSKVEPINDTYRVLAPVQLTPIHGDFSPRTIQTERLVTYNFTFPLEKAGTPGVDLDSVSISFAGNDVSCTVPEFGRGFAEETVECTVPDARDLVGSNGEHDVTFTMLGTDDNGLPVEEIRTISDLIRIDNILPIIEFDPIELPTDADGDQQTEAKSNDTVTVSGTVSRGADNGEEGSEIEITFVELRATSGDVVEVEVTRDGDTFSGEAELDFPDAANTDTHTFRARGQVVDEAGNTADNSSTAEVFDDVPPVLRDPGRTVMDERYTLGGQFSFSPDVEVMIEETHTLHGGCSRLQWTVSGHGLPDAVLYSNGERCGVGEDPGDGIRILVVDDEGNDPGSYTPMVTYENRTLLGSSLGSRVKDGAGNFAVEQTIDTVIGILPPAPDLIRALRNNATEDAPFDDDTFWTRFDGNDLLLTVSSIRLNWFVEVLDENGNVVHTSDQADEDGEFDVTVPVGAVADDTEAVFERGVRFVNPQADADARIGELTEFTVTVNTIDPLIGAAERLDDGETVEVTFSEKVWDGDENASDWFVWEEAPEGSDTDRWYYQVDRVDGGRDTVWTLTASSMEGEPFGGADYFMVRDNGQRLEDRAGNVLANTLE